MEQKRGQKNDEEKRDIVGEQREKNVPVVPTHISVRANATRKKGDFVPRSLLYEKRRRPLDTRAEIYMGRILALGYTVYSKF